MNKYESKKIEEIRAMTTSTIPLAIKNNVSINEYLRYHRYILNCKIIEAIFGAELSTDSVNASDAKCRFNHNRASSEGLATIGEILNVFINEVEYPYINTNLDDEDDMSIPVPVTDMGVVDINNNPISNSKIRVKSSDLVSYLFGGHAGSISASLITHMDVLKLATLAERYKKMRVRNAAIVISGFMILSCSAWALYDYTHHNHDIDNPDIPDDNIDDTYNDMHDDAEIPYVSYESAEYESVPETVNAE